MKKTLLFFIILLNSFIILFSYENIPCKTSPKPKRCLQFENNAIVCAATASAMVMTYWEKLNLVKKNGCLGYAQQFRSAFNTNDGGSFTNSKLFEKAFKQVVEGNKNLEPGLKKQVNTRSFELTNWVKIRDMITNSESESPLSPWNRPGVLVGWEQEKGPNDIAYAIGIAHAKLIWGIKDVKSIQKISSDEKPSINVKYMTIDPIMRIRKSHTTFRFGENEGFATFWWPEKCSLN